jgi:virginiamycin B lyase
LEQKGIPQPGHVVLCTAHSFAPHGNPLGITTGPDGRLWFADYIGDRLGAITADGIVTEYPVRNTPPPSLLNISGVTSGPDGAIWFTEVDGNKIGRMTAFLGDSLT